MDKEPSLPTLSDTKTLVSDEFQRLTDPYQHELLVHCYRFLGSIFDAEDALQETLLRAWRRLDSLRDQSSLRAWLYRIATNVSLDMISQRKARSMPALIYAPANPQDPLPLPVMDPVWLEPLPEEYLGSQSFSPEARYDSHESVTLAFLAVLQMLPPRQRAVLILRDVLGWKAEEVADLLEVSTAAVNSALQRARLSMNKHQADWAYTLRPKAEDSRTEILLTRYRQAWESADPSGLISLLREDAILTMPPLSAWYQGRGAILAFYANMVFSSNAPGNFRILPTRANDSPAFATYQRGENGVFYPASFQVLTIAGDQIIQIDSFLVTDDRLFSKFGLPVSL